MPHIALPEGLPGMQALLAYRPEIAPPLLALMQVLMRETDTLGMGMSDLDASNPRETVAFSMGLRELVATEVSRENRCEVCRSIHGAVASCLLAAERGMSADASLEQVPLTEPEQCVLALARAVTRGERSQVVAHLQTLRGYGYGDETLHDLVLLSALFTMYNKYIDGLGLVSQDTEASLRERAAHIAVHGYQRQTGG